jgi:hypothetical protein
MRHLAQSRIQNARIAARSPAALGEEGIPLASAFTYVLNFFGVNTMAEAVIVDNSNLVF